LKRSVAIIGPTPGFLRWAIWQPCPLRERDDLPLPDTTFRQLRGVREISVGRIENRIFENICVHPLANSREPELALGFPIFEVAGLFGGPEQIKDACWNCPANAVSAHQPGLLAGCFGWLPVDFNFDFEKLTRGEFDVGETEAAGAALTSELVDLVERAVAKLQLEELIQQTFLATRPVWYGLWSHASLSQEQLPVIEQLFMYVLANEEAERRANSAHSTQLTDLIRFVDAVSSCREHSLPLHVDFVPAGVSDGINWTILPHCGYCGFSIDNNLPRECPACGQPGNRQQETKHKVLGLRPYLHLHSILGSQQTAEFLLRYESRNV
jgi:hypothetical protein